MRRGRKEGSGAFGFDRRRQPQRQKSEHTDRKSMVAAAAAATEYTEKRGRKEHGKIEVCGSHLALDDRT